MLRAPQPRRAAASPAMRLLSRWVLALSALWFVASLATAPLSLGAMACSDDAALSDGAAADGVLAPDRADAASSQPREAPEEREGERDEDDRDDDSNDPVAAAAPARRAASPQDVGELRRVAARPAGSQASGERSAHRRGIDRPPYV